MIGEICAFGTSFLWSISPYVFTKVVRRTGTFLLNTSRLLLTMVLMLLTILIFKLNFSSNYEQIIYLSLSGFIGLVLGDTYLFKSFKEIGPRITMIVMASNPIFGALIAFLLFGETISFVGILGMFVTILGIVLVVGENRTNNNPLKINVIGLVYALLASIGQAVGLVFTKMAYFEGEIHPIYAAFVRIVSALFFLVVLGIFTKRFKWQHINKTFNLPTISMLILGSLIGPYFGVTLSFIAVTNAPVGIASTIMSLQPVIMLPISRYYFKEKIKTKALIGSIFAVLGLVLLFMRKTF